MSQRAEIFCNTGRQREVLNKKRIFEVGLQKQDLGSKYFEKSIVQKSCNSLIYIMYLCKVFYIHKIFFYTSFLTYLSIYINSFWNIIDYYVLWIKNKCQKNMVISQKWFRHENVIPSRECFLYIRQRLFYF
jgi:hypothetical protein